MHHVHLINPNPTVVELSKCLHNSSWPSLSCCYQMNGIDIRLGYTNLRGILGGKWTIRYKSISDILISRFSGVNKCLQGRNIFVIDFGSSQYQKFVISLILHICRISCLHRELMPSRPLGFSFPRPKDRVATYKLWKSLERFMVATREDLAIKHSEWAEATYQKNWWNQQSLSWSFMIVKELDFRIPYRPWAPYLSDGEDGNNSGQWKIVSRT